jgi:hypothetical protein
MKLRFAIPLFFGFSSMTALSNPVSNFVCIDNQTQFSVQVFLNRTPVLVAPRYLTPVTTINNGQILAQMNTRQLVGRLAGWTDLVLFPNNVACTQDNTVSIGMTNRNVLYFN